MLASLQEDLEQSKILASFTGKAKAHKRAGAAILSIKHKALSIVVQVLLHIGECCRAFCRTTGIGRSISFRTSLRLSYVRAGIVVDDRGATLEDEWGACAMIVEYVVRHPEALAQEALVGKAATTTLLGVQGAVEYHRARTLSELLRQFECLHLR